MKMIHYSWREFFLIIAVVLALYYAYIILRYYRKELHDFLRGKQKNEDPALEEVEIIDPFEKYTPQEPADRIDEENFVLAEELIIRLKELISDATDQEMDEHHTLRAITSLFREYPTIKDKVLQSGITDMILSECEIRGSIRPERGALDELWRLAQS